MENLLTVEEVAPRVRMSVQGLYYAIREKQFPHVRIGKRVRVPESSLKKWIEDQIDENTKTQEPASSLATVS